MTLVHPGVMGCLLQNRQCVGFSTDAGGKVSSPDGVPGRGGGP